MFFLTLTLENMTTMEDNNSVVEFSLNKEEIELVAGFARVDMAKDSYIEKNLVRLLSIYPNPYDLKNRQAEIRKTVNKLLLNKYQFNANSCYLS